MYRVLGGIKGVDSMPLAEALLKKYPDLKHRPRVFGYDIRLIRNGLEMHVETLDEEIFDIDIWFEASENALRLFLEDLKSILLSLDCHFWLSYHEADDDAEQVSPDKFFYASDASG